MDFVGLDTHPHSPSHHFWITHNYMNLIFVVPCIMLNSEINPTRCNNCVYSSQWLYLVLVCQFCLLGVYELNICGSVHHA